jgi:hypothetical protein
MSDLTIRPINTGDRAAWDPLWAGYLAFYETTVSADVTEFTWKRLTAAWQTEEFNATARRLYERVAKRSPFSRYQIEL